MTRRRGASLTEILLAISVLIVCMLPLLGLVSRSRRDAMDAVAILSLLPHAGDPDCPSDNPSTGSVWPQSLEHTRVARDGRELSLTTLDVDGEGSYAPLLGEGGVRP